MEENSEKQDNLNDFQDFQDFEDEEVETPELEADLIEQEKAKNEDEEGDLLKDAQHVLKLQQEMIAGGMGKPEAEKEESQEEIPEEAEEKTEQETEQKEATEEIQQIEQAEETLKIVQNKELPPETDGWEELNDENSVVKKYIVYVSKDFVPLMDGLTTDERSAYINDAIQRKIDTEEEISSIEKKKRILTHIIITVLTFLIFAPIALFIVHKSIMVTFENYKYSQDNFEKLYKQRFEKDRAYMRSIEYNRLHSKDVKNEQ